MTTNINQPCPADQKYGYHAPHLTEQESGYIAIRCSRCGMLLTLDPRCAPPESWDTGFVLAARVHELETRLAAFDAAEDYAAMKGRLNRLIEGATEWRQKAEALEAELLHARKDISVQLERITELEKDADQWEETAEALEADKARLDHACPCGRVLRHVADPHRD